MNYDRSFIFQDDEKAEDEMAKRRAAFLLKQQRKAEEARLRKQQQEAESELKRDEARYIFTQTHQTHTTCLRSVHKGIFLSHSEILPVLTHLHIVLGVRLKRSVFVRRRRRFDES